MRNTCGAIFAGKKACYVRNSYCLRGFIQKQICFPDYLFQFHECQVSEMSFLYAEV